MEKKLPEGWEWKTLREISSSIMNGGTPSTKHHSYWEGEIPWVTGSSIKGMVITAGEKFISKEALDNSAAKIIPKNNLLFVTRIGIGKAAVNTIDLSISQDITGIELKGDIINPHYLARYIQSPKISSMLISWSRGSTIKGLQRSQIEQLLIPIPPLETQRKIIAILDKVEETKRLRAQSNELTHKILQSVFLEMFGDPGTNKMNWDIKLLSELVSTEKGIMCGPFGSALKIGELVEKGVPALVIGNVESNRFNWNKIKYITEKKAEQLSEFSVAPGDVLVLRTGTVGRACMVPDNLGKAVIGPDLLRIRFDMTKMIPEFFSYALNNMPSFLDRVKSISPGATLAHLNATLLKKMEIIAPPIQNQIHFLKKYQQIEKLSVLNQQFSQSENLLSSILVKKAFSGELVA